MMRRYALFMAFFFLLFATGCLPDKAKLDAEKWNINLENTDKRPYGTYLANQSLKYFFPDAKIEILSRGFKYDNIDDRMRDHSNGKSLLILEGLSFNVSLREWDALKNFAGDGNELVIFCSSIDNKVSEELNITKSYSGDESSHFYFHDSDFDYTQALVIAGNETKKFGYHGRMIEGFFSFKSDEDYLNAKAFDNDHSGGTLSAEDSIIPARPDTLGYSYRRPNFVRYTVGAGHICFHAAPLALSNYFLLQDGNQEYLSLLWQTLPADIAKVYWQDYLYRDTDASSMDILWRHPATRFALVLAIFALAVYVLFESKRKQRIIPIVAPLKNDSVSFVETVGRLYYNKGNNANLAEKMTLQFLEWVRSHYFLNTNLINEHFIKQLTIKSGLPEATVRGLVEMINEIRMGNIKVDDAYLYQLYYTIQQFYKNNIT